jgi:dTDP-4-dehydrorhamnose 3,5-epimerase
MPLGFTTTNISGLTLITTHQYDDGLFSISKYYQNGAFKDAGLLVNFTESNIISYKKGTLRGLHYQKNPSQGKLIYLISGAIFVAALDLRGGSETFGRYECFSFTPKCHKAVFIPEYFAVGVLSLAEHTTVSYCCTGKFMPEKCGGIIWSDIELHIPWPIDNLDGPVLLTEKDKKLQNFSEYRRLSV